MTTTDSELHEMFDATRRMSRGPAKFAALDAVFRHADAAGNVPFAFRARMDALSDFHHGGDYTRAFMAFSWCLATFDRQPEIGSPETAHGLLWRFKWIVWELSQFPAVPLDRTVALLDDMERRYRLGGHSLHAVYQHRGLIAHHLGDLDAADGWYDKMISARRDELSDCHACVPTSHVQHLVARQQYAQAVEIGTPYTRGGCTEQPHWMLSELLVAYVHTGRFEDAANAHRNAYRMIRTNPHHLDLISLNVQFCGLTGNEHHALPIIERHLPWLERPASPYVGMEFAASAALVLRRLRETGFDDARVARRSGDGTRVWESTVAETHTEMVAHARALAAQFDARNGNSYQSHRIEARMAAQPLVEALPLTVLAGRPIAAGARDARIDALVTRIADQTAAGDAASAARGRLELAYALRSAAQWADATETGEEARRSLDRAGLIDDALAARYLLFELYVRTRNHRAEAAALLDELLAASALPPSVPAIEVLLEQGADQVGGPHASDRLARAAAIYRTQGNAPAEARTLRKVLRVTATLSGAADGSSGTGPAQSQPSVRGRDVIDRLDELTASGLLASPQAIEADKAVSMFLAVNGEYVAALDRIDEADAYMAEHGIEEYELDDGD